MSPSRATSGRSEVVGDAAEDPLLEKSSKRELKEVLLLFRVGGGVNVLLSGKVPR